MLNHKLFTPIQSYSRRFDNEDALCAKDPLHQRTRTPETFLHQKPFLTPGFMRFFHQKTLTPETFHKQSAQCTPKTLRHQ